jgi:predicted regulator of amino acid metabolism with ACT domain
MRNKRTLWLAEYDTILIGLYPNTPNKEITRVTGWSTSVLKHQCERLGLKKTRACKAKTAGAIEWSEEMIQYLKDNFLTMTNKELASALGLRVTITRTKAYELGMKKAEAAIGWNVEQTKYLTDNYHAMGDVELAANLQKKWPRRKAWTKKHVNKKRYLLNLHRTLEQVQKIMSVNGQLGGNSYTIIRNSASATMADGYVANLLAWRNKELRQEILKYPELIELKRKELLLSKAIKESKNA